MDVRARIEELLSLTARKTAAEERIEAIRTELTEEALRRYRDEGAAPSWKTPGLGTVSLAGIGGTGELLVTDGAAFHAWVAANYPTEATRTVTLTVDLATMTVEEADEVAAHVATQVQALAELGLAAAVRDELGVRDAFTKALLTNGVVTEVADPEDDAAPGKLITEAGELVPGVSVRRKRYITTRLDAQAKARALAEVRLASEDPDEAGDTPDEDELTDRAADAIADLVIADANLRGDAE